jgi:murein DD-endopeptidase MepM/ murein hydrolase activator NlpD
LEIIVINERKNKSFNLVLNWSIFGLIIIVILAILVLFVYGVINFARGRGDYKRVQQLVRENSIVEKQIDHMEAELRTLNITIDSLTRSDTVLQRFSSLQTLKMVIARDIAEKVEGNSIDNKDFGQLSTYLDELILRVENQYSTNSAILSYLKQKEYLKNSIPSIAPVNGWYVRGFGYCLDPFTGSAKMHEGIDIAAPISTPIIAPADGIVRKIQNTKDFGIVIEISHNQDLSTVYGHCMNPTVNAGQSIKRGDVIGYVGLSGKTSGPHLHYEIRISQIPVDPLNYIIIDKTADN